MLNQEARGSGGRDHWDTRYQSVPPTKLSWYQDKPSTSLDMIEGFRLPRSTAVIDVGGGASTLAEHLIASGFDDVSVLDISSAALEHARGRIADAERIHWLHEDLLSWQPARRYDLWHDRAVFHFLVVAQDQQRYLSTLRSALKPGGTVIIATFALDGPERCSGLPVARYGPDDLADRLTDAFDIVDVRREEHTTPAGDRQPFTWLAARARSG